MSQISALGYFALCLGVVVFQICLIAGAPWGRLTQGGSNRGKLPRRGRIAAGFSAVLLLCMGLAILSAAGNWPNWPIWTGWVALATSGVSVVANLMTPSVPERMLWGPVTLVMLGLAAVVTFAN